MGTGVSKPLDGVTWPSHAFDVRNVDAAVLEAFVAAPDRRAALEKQVVGTQAYLDMLLLLSEQLSYPEDLEKKISTWIAQNDKERKSPRIKQYDFRKQLNTFNPATGFTGETGEALLTRLKEDLGITTSTAKPWADTSTVGVVTASNVGSAGAAAVSLGGADSTWTEAGSGPDDLLKACIKKYANADSDYYGPEWMSHICTDLFAHEHPLVVSAASTSGRTQYHYISHNWGSDLPDVPSISSLVKDAMGSDWVKKHSSPESVASSTFQHLNLEQLRNLTSFFSRWDSSVQLLWLQAFIARQAPPAHVDLRMDRDAADAYCDAVLATLHSTSMAGRAANEMRYQLAVHKLMNAYAVSSSWSSPTCTEALRGLLSVPAYGFPWDKRDTGIISAVMRTHADACNVRYPNASTALALPDTPHTQVQRMVVDAMMDILGGASTAKPGAKDAIKPWNKWMDEDWLMSALACARILRGDADPALWSGQLVAGSRGGLLASNLESLRSTKVLRFTDACRDFFLPADPVLISFVCKGIQRVTVSVFELNTTAYYQANDGAEIPSDISLDGLIPVGRQDVDHEAEAAAAGQAWSPFTQKIVSVPISALSPPTSAAASVARTRRGVFVVEITGGGLSCRALIRKGALRVLERATVAGHVLTIVDEANVPLPATEVSVTLARTDRRYTPRAAAPAGMPEILVPFDPSDSRRRLIVTHDTLVTDEAGATVPWTFSTVLPDWSHAREWYELQAAFFVERETLIKDCYSATLLVRPQLFLHGAQPCSTAPLENVCLTLDATDGEGTTSSRVFKNLTLSSNADVSVTFAVPPGMRSMNASLTADINILATGARDTLRASHRVELNGVEGTDHTRDIYLRATSTGYVLCLLGKTGEPVVGESLNIRLTSLYVKENVTFYKSTDGAGCVYLGPLSNFSQVEVTSYSTGSSRSSTGAARFQLPTDTVTYPSLVHCTDAGDGGAFDATASRGAKPTARAIQLALPFRPPPSGVAAGVKFKLTSRDVRFVEVRPAPCGASSVQYGGSGNGVEVRIRDMLQEGDRTYVSYDAATSSLLVHDLTPGEYLLTVKRPFPGCRRVPEPVRIRVLPAATTRAAGGHLICGSLALQLPSHVQQPSVHPTAGTITSQTALAPVHIASVQVAGEDAAPAGAVKAAGAKSAADVVIRVSGGSGGPGPATHKSVRVHLVATYFVPVWDAGDQLASVAQQAPGLLRWSTPRSRYLESRQLPEEFQYVFDRQVALTSAAPPLPANLLPRPSLLLHPWSIGGTITETQDAKDGTAYASTVDASSRAALKPRALARPTSPESGMAAAHRQHMCLDFLARPALVLTNLRPDASTGEVRIPVQTLLMGTGDKPATWDVMLTVVAVDAASAASHTCVLPSDALGTTPAVLNVGQFRDLTRSSSFLPVDSHAVHSSRIVSLAEPGASAVINTGGSFVKVEPVGSLDKVLSFFHSLSGSNTQLVSEWSWLLQWPQLSDEDKSSKYSKYACHELHLFLYFKDGAFFETVVRPFLATKRAKTFIDAWLLDFDLSEFAAPHALNQLNALEKALFAAKPAPLTNAAAPDLAAAIAAHLRDAVDNAPLDGSLRDDVFTCAFKSDSLSASAPPSAQPPRPAMRPPSMAPGGPMAAFGSAAPPPPPCAPMMSMAPSHMPSASVARRGFVAKKAMAVRDEAQEVEEEADEFCAPCEADVSCLMDMDDSNAASMRAQAATMLAYRAIDKTAEYAENNYYGVPNTCASTSLFAVNEFWADLAEHWAAVVRRTAAACRPALSAVPAEAASTAAAELTRALRSSPFVTTNVGALPVLLRSRAYALNHMLAGLAVLGLPWEQSEKQPPAPPAVVTLDDGARIRYTAGATPLVLFYQDLTECDAASSSAVLCGQTYFDPADRYRTVDGAREEQSLPTTTTNSTGHAAIELLVGKLYGCSVIITNVTPESQAMEVLLRIPQGALPANNGFFSKTVSSVLGAFSTRRFEYFFYFPAQGEYGHFPVHVSDSGVLLSQASVTYFAVVSQIKTRRDVASWLDLSVNGSLEAVLAYLATANVFETDLQRLCWRCTDATAYRAISSALRLRHMYFAPIWNFAFQHKDVMGVTEVLAQPSNMSRLLRSLGPNPFLRSPLISLVSEEGVGVSGVDICDVGMGTAAAQPSVDVYTYEHLEYSPLVNARAHQLGSTRKILNKSVERQYKQLLVLLSAKPQAKITAADLMAVVYHLLLQDRIQEAKSVYAAIPAPVDSVVAGLREGAGSDSSTRGSATAAAESSADALLRVAGVNWMTLQYDYLSAYLDFFVMPSGSASATTASMFPCATAVAAAYTAYPVAKWAAKFQEVADLLRDINAGRTASKAEHLVDAVDAGVSKELAREAQQKKMVAKEAQLDFQIEDGKLVLTYANVRQAHVRMYSMDIEVLFSTSPFLTAFDAGSSNTSSSPSGSSEDLLGKFSYIRPNSSWTVDLPAALPGAICEHSVPLPASVLGTNAMIEVTTPEGAMRRVHPFFSNQLQVVVTQSAGRLRVLHAKSGRPLSRVYVKVFYQTGASDAGKFFKDGYTSISGMFDYVSLSTSELDRATRLAILVSSAKYGSEIRMVAKP